MTYIQIKAKIEESHIEYINTLKDQFEDKLAKLNEENAKMISFLTKENRKLVSDVKELRHCAECDSCPIKDCELRNME